eukprot:scaffold1143_cov177-Amphora_coffeaeformis.AAC.26
MSYDSRGAHAEYTNFYSEWLRSSLFTLSALTNAFILLTVAHAMIATLPSSSAAAGKFCTHSH